MRTAEGGKGIGLCLGGGGARGIAHLGVLKALDELSIPIKAISGTSAGAIAGCLYASGMKPEKILNEIESSAWYKIFKPGNIRLGFTDHTYLSKILKRNLNKNGFEDLPIDFYACVTDLKKGQYYILNSGNLFEAVMASSSIPVVFEPVKIDKMLCVDGGLLNNLPVEPLKERGLKVIGVNINTHGEESKLDNMLQIASRTFNITVWKNTEERWHLCDAKVDVTQAFDFGMFDFRKGEKLFNIGYDAAMKVKEELLTLKNMETL